MVIGAIFVAAILVVLVGSNTEFLKGSLQNLASLNGYNTQNTVQTNAGSLVVEYIKIPDKNEIQIGSLNESLGEYKFKVQEEPIIIEGITFEMEGNVTKDIFNNIKLLIAGNEIENANYTWLDENSLSLKVDMSAKNYELQGDTILDLKGDINGGESGQMFAFHFIGIDAKGKTSNAKIENVGVNGSATPMPQIHSLIN